MDQIALGQKIRDFRKGQEQTLSQLAASAEISPSFLSQIERGQAHPSVTTLYAIAQALAISVADFFAEPSDDSERTANTHARIVRAAERKQLVYPGSGIRNELLSPDLQRSIQLMWVVMPPHTDTGEAPFIHPGEECGIVLQGTLETWVGDERYLLGPGDAIYHDSTLPHRSCNIGDDEVIIVVAKTPPSI